MIPLRDVIPSRTTPYITVTIIVLNALAWLFELSLPHDALNEFLTVYGVVPAYFSWPTLITSMFLHGSWSHVIGNMWYLWIFGDNVEDRVGHGRFIVFYLLGGIIAAFGQIAMEPGSTLPTIGASGAIAGVMGGYFVLFPRSRVLTLIPFIWIQIHLNRNGEGEGNVSLAAKLISAGGRNVVLENFDVMQPVRLTQLKSEKLKR